MDHFKEKSDGAPSPYFRVGESVPSTGQYRVFHSGHRVSHDVILMEGAAFPRCTECGANVHFELILANPPIAFDRDFQSLRVYEIPHPVREEQKK